MIKIKINGLALILFSIVLLNVSVGCNNPPATVEQPHHSEPNSDIPVNATLPFGNMKLTTFQYPKRWNIDAYNSESASSSDDMEFGTLGNNFNSINRSPNIIFPEVKEIENFNFNNNKLDAYYFDTIASRAIDSCKYRLPDMGKYECYYFVAVSNKANYGIYGNLLLLDSKSRKGKLLNIFYEYGGDQSTNYRYFCINDGCIRVFDGACYDDGCWLDERYSITLWPNGELDIGEKIECFATI